MSDNLPDVKGLPPSLEHPLRQSLAGEVHARPYDALTTPVRISHMAIMHDAATQSAPGQNANGGWHAHLAQLLAAHGAEIPGPDVSFCQRALGSLRLRFERHSEFTTYTFLRFDDFTDPFAETALDLLPRPWLESLPGKALVALHLTMIRGEPVIEPPTTDFEGNTLAGATLMDAAAQVWTDFRLHADGFGRILIRDNTLSRGQAGRLAQRLWEIETYRMMALLAYPPARQASGEIGRIHNQVAAIIDSLADAAVPTSDRVLLDKLTDLAAQAERLVGANSYRLSAAQAYHSLVNQRIAELREARIHGVQTVGEFMARRLAPAMATCANCSERMEALANRIARASDLLRTRVDIALEERNTDLLKAMNRRARLQLRLQEAVEGLSAVAISYYMLGLTGYFAKGLKAAGVHVDPDLTMLIALPVVVGTVIFGLRRVRHGAKTEG